MDREEPEVPDFEDYAEPGDVPARDREALREEERSFDESPEERFSEEALVGGDEELPF